VVPIKSGSKKTTGNIEDLRFFPFLSLPIINPCLHP
jgi:hypothetical protein